MKARIVSKNALRMEGTDLVDVGFDDYAPIVVGKIGLTDSSTTILTSWSAFLMVDVYLFYKDFENAS